MMDKTITIEEAHGIAKRFIDGHFNNPGEKPRIRIPADPDHDDDLRLRAFIDQHAALLADAERLREEACEYYITPEKVTRFDSPEAVREMRRKAAGRMLEMEAEAERQRWQPIDTAPRNTSVLIYLPNREHYGEPIYRAILVDMGSGPRWTTTGLHIGRDLCKDEQPTHWMPLPPPPAPRQATGEEGGQ